MRPPDPPGADARGPDAVTAELLQSAYRYAVSLAADSADAEDLVQESWLRVRETYGAEADRRILFRTLRNLHFDGWRRARRFPSETLDESDAATSDEGAGDPSRWCGGGALGGQLARLRDVEREALLLSVIEGYSANEIARLTGSTRGTVLSLVHRAKAKLQGWLEEATDTPGATDATDATDATGGTGVERDGGGTAGPGAIRLVATNNRSAKR